MTGHNQNNLQKVEKKEMFDNIGGKIKGVAKIITWMGIITSVISFLIILSTGDDKLIGFGFIILIVGCIVSWLSSLTLYGFGQLIENSEIIAGKSPISGTCKGIQVSQQTENKNMSTLNNSKNFDELIEDMDLTDSQITKIYEYIELKNEGLITETEFRNRITKLLSDSPLDWVTQLFNILNQI